MNNSTFSGLLGLVLTVWSKMLSRKSLRTANRLAGQIANRGIVFSHDLVYKTHDYSGWQTTAMRRRSSARSGLPIRIAPPALIFAGSRRPAPYCPRPHAGLESKATMGYLKVARPVEEL